MVKVKGTNNKKKGSNKAKKTGKKAKSPAGKNGATTKIKKKATAAPTADKANSNWEKMKAKLQSSSSKKNKKRKRPAASSKSVSKSSAFGRNTEAATSSSNLVSTYLLDATRSDDVTQVVAMDCEMVGVGFKQISAVARCTVVNYYGQIIYDEYCRPAERITDYRTRYSGIRKRDLVGARPFKKLQQEVADLLKGRMLVGHGLENDLKALMLTHPRGKRRDSAHWAKLKIKRANGLKSLSRKLKDLAKEFFDWDIQEGEHSPSLMRGPRCGVQEARKGMGAGYTEPRQEGGWWRRCRKWGQRCPR